MVTKVTLRVRTTQQHTVCLSNADQPFTIQRDDKYGIRSNLVSRKQHATLRVSDEHHVVEVDACRDVWIERSTSPGVCTRLHKGCSAYVRVHHV